MGAAQVVRRPSTAPRHARLWLVILNYPSVWMWVWLSSSVLARGVEHEWRTHNARVQSSFLSGNRHVPSTGLSEDGGAEQESEDELGGSRSSLERQGHRGNTTVHVCWHRNTSVSMVDFSIAVEVPLPCSCLCFFSSHILFFLPTFDFGVQLVFFFFSMHKGRLSQCPLCLFFLLISVFVSCSLSSTCVSCLHLYLDFSACVHWHW